ncbi:hypothetical protein Fleli_0565 [Bernardetia litoralis DSM 6794]|uniref:Bacteroidetes-specific membrane protein n=1 Tax=Bernardetia litoralis (strain ATCC 23117 / DSM 6794 / NBRC 15988 / NCIMB 1366 / Fx l1 / Sio-4) TaxID=880071 RepID=I4AGE7_BERLS|nr:hypothetical protein [Bernardetia litoralis]AFM03032.1 hypothetical protein Fleli_0565 [Bernardetia litoralis DSM 6794]
MKKIYSYLFPFLVFILLQNNCFAQFGQVESGARTYGMGRTSLTVADSWAVLNNVAALSNVKGTEAFLGYSNRFTLSGLNTLQAGATFDAFFDGKMGVGVTRFGDDLYNEHRLAIGYAHKISNMSIGIQANYLQTSIQGYGTSHNFALEMGGVAQLSETLTLGMHIFNINQAKVADFEDERIPTIMRIGISYKPVERVTVNFETEKDTEYPASFKAGIEYQAINHNENQVFIRTGITTEEFLAHFGIGYYKGSFGLDYAFTTLPQVGYSHHVGLIYRFGKARNQNNDQEEKTNVNVPH